MIDRRAFIRLSGLACVPVLSNTLFGSLSSLLAADDSVAEGTAAIISEVPGARTVVYLGFGSRAVVKLILLKNQL